MHNTRYYCLFHFFSSSLPAFIFKCIRCKGVLSVASCSSAERGVGSTAAVLQIGIGIYGSAQLFAVLSVYS